MQTSLHASTRHLHHACEQHSVGQRMSRGDIARQEWADWLWAFRCLHLVVDAALPSGMDRSLPLLSDLACLPSPHVSRAAASFAADLAAAPSRLGAAYVLHGAHLSGGRVMAPILAKRGLPVQHTVYAQPHVVHQWLKGLREEGSLADQACATFACLLAVMDEIEARASAC